MKTALRLLSSIAAFGFTECASPETVPEDRGGLPQRAPEGADGGALSTSAGSGPTSGALSSYGGWTTGPMGNAGGSTGAGGTGGGGGLLQAGGRASASSGGLNSSGGTLLTGGKTAVGGTSPALGGNAASAGSAGKNPTGGTPTASGSGASPELPAITGTCPNLVSGTTSIGGLSGISLQVGAKKQGTGSLLFYWHGTGSTASEVNLLLPAGARQEILAQGGIIVSFQGSTGTGGDCSGTATFSKDDFKIADLIAACAVRDYGIDPRRIYTTGCSAGGLQAGCMGAMRSSYIAAAVPNSGGVVVPVALQASAHTPSVMTMHGGTSDVVIVTFSQTSATYDQQMKAAGSFVVNCNHGGGHCQAPAALYSAGWEFMKAHPFDVNPEPYASALPSGFPSYCKIY